MAPNKRKKKAAANPARGFATTSLPSKSKTSDTTPYDSDSTASFHSSAKVVVSAPQSATSGRTRTASREKNGPDQGPTEIHMMSPEQLELHLEDSELQSLLDANAARCKSDASRQLLRLATERRQFRGQAISMPTHSWLDDSFVDEVIAAHIDGFRTGYKQFDSSRAVPHIDESKLLLDLWVLQQVLKGLDLPNLTDVLSFVAKSALSQCLESRNEAVYGLAEALEWYALNTDPKLLSDYEQVSPSATRDHQLAATPSEIPKSNHTGENSADKKPGIPSAVSETESTESSLASESDDNNDPSVLVDKYLRIKTLVWERNNSHRILHTPQSKAKNRSRKLHERLSHIERDILFDQATAESRWKLIAIDLELEYARNQQKEKKVQKTLVSTTLFDDGRQPSTEPIGEVRGREETIIADDGDTENSLVDDELFGSIFVTSEESSSDANAQKTSKGVRVLGFGKWTGLAPKALLQETSKTLDGEFQLSLHILHQSSYSVRHKIELAWPKNTLPDNTAISSLPEGIITSIFPRRWTLEMDSIAASTAINSEAYISTLMLFLVSSTGDLDSRPTNRLPTVWRDEIKQLGEKRKELINTTDKTTLRGLRAVLHVAKEALKSADSPRNKQLSALETSLQHGRKPDRRTDTQTYDAATAQQQWRSRELRPSFQAMLKFRRQLPIYAFKAQILETIARNPISIISAETGSGKSTQTGSFILESELAAGRDCHILVTQPRRISAISLARRVSEELGESKNDIGTVRSLVGYAIRLESETSSSTRLTFATTGVLLRMFESSPTLEQLNYLILDEVHDRTMDLDLLFIALRQIQQKRPSLKIILMSATLNAKGFSNYFGGAPVLEIPGRTFPVEVRYLEDAVEITNDIRGSHSPSEAENSEEPALWSGDSSDERSSSLTGLEHYSSITRARLAKMDEYRIDYELITRLATAIATKPGYSKYSSAILIFMTGLGEIRRLFNALVSTDTFSHGWIIHLLHSSFSTEDLERAFARPPPEIRKIVIATNIAETGITIPDVTAVIDTCKEKVMRFNEKRQVSKLSEGFISRSSARQRRGRAARVQEGICFHLITRHRHDKLLLEQQIPEMLRLSLQDPILRVKIWNLGSIEETLAAAIDPPSRKNIIRAIDKLKDAGALTKSEELTPLGLEIARLPLEVTLAKLAIFGAIFKCLDSTLVLIAILTSKSLFVTSATSHHENDTKLSFHRADSDLLSSLNAYEEWRKAKTGGSAHDFCRKNHLSDQSLMQIEDQKIQLLVYLVDAGLVVLDSEEKSALSKARVSTSSRKGFYRIPDRFDRKVGDETLLCIIAMAFYPRVLVREGRGWRNVYTNQHVSLTSGSVNYASTKPPKWLSFYEAMQTKKGNLSVFETSSIPDVAIALIVGEAEVKLFSGVISIDNGRIRLAVRHWRQAMAIKILRKAVQEVLAHCYERPGSDLPAVEQQWMELLLKMTAAQGANH